MTDPLRTDGAVPSAEVSQRDRLARQEELLLSGLDHYFAGQYELAINVWTRVLFLDRGHARARAYIERARGAIAERQREGEELIQTGAAALQRGEVDAARRLLTSAVEQGAETDEAIALLGRLERLEAAAVQPEARKDRRTDENHRVHVRRERVPASRRSRLVWIAAGALLGITAGAAAIGLLWMRSDEWLPINAGSSSSAASRPPEDPLIIPSPGDARMALACSLRATGNLRDALAALDAIRPGDPVKPQADAFRASMQAQLLAASRSGQPGAPSTKQQESGVYCQ
jgi:tetratricopeptide (TPR) repeat protein